MGAVEVRELSKVFEGKTVLEGVSLDVGQGELVTLLGPSGCGKTTTLRCVAGLERPDGGEIRIGGRVVAAGGRKAFEPPNRRGVGMVFQSYALWPHMTVFANVAYPLRVRRRDRKERRKAVMEVLAAVGMDQYALRSVTALSGGQQQRVALARAMVAQPEVLLFDEPLSNLDAKLRAAMRKEIRAVHERAGAASIYVTHDQEEAITLSDRVVVLDRGAIQQVGTPKAIYRRPANAFVADFVGFDNLVPAVVADRRGGLVGLRLAGGDGRLLAASDHELPTGAEVTFAVRAEDLALEPLPEGADPPPDSVVAGIVSATYVGDSIERGLELGGHRLVARTPETDEAVDAALRPGRRALVRVAPERAVALAGGPTPADEPAPAPENAPVPDALATPGPDAGAGR